MDNKVNRLIKTFYNVENINKIIQDNIDENDIENISDGYHTFKELYEFRKLYNAALFHEWAENGKVEVYKSKRHFDGEECFGGGWFIVMIDTPFGQISNHYENKYWDEFHCEEKEIADEWDGHTEKDVLERLMKCNTSNNPTV